ncbi:MAG: hypothetical protein Q9207_003047 [Kuettlingeria erythrocarpa]
MDHTVTRRNPITANKLLERPEPQKSENDILSRIRSLFASPDTTRPPATPCPIPTSVRTAAHSTDGDNGVSSGTTNFSVAHARNSSLRRADSDLFAHTYDGPADRVPEPPAGASPRQSTQRDVIEGLGSERDGQSTSTSGRVSSGTIFSRSRHSLREPPKSSDPDGPRRVRSTLGKASAKPRHSLYNLKATSSAESTRADKRGNLPAEEAKFRINHVPGSFGSEYNASIRGSETPSSASVSDAALVKVEPPLGHSFEAVSSRRASKNEETSPEDESGQPVNIATGGANSEDGERPTAVVPLLRPMLSSYTIYEMPLTSAPVANSALEFTTLPGLVDGVEGQLPDSDLVQAVQATSNQALLPDLGAKSAVAAVDLQRPVPSDISQATVASDAVPGRHASPPVVTKPTATAAEVDLRSSGEILRGRQGVTSGFVGSKDSRAIEALHELSPSPISEDRERLRETPPTLHDSSRLTKSSQQLTHHEPDSSSRWMRQLLGHNSAPAMGETPPNLTARPRHRSRKVTEDVNLQRSHTVPAQANQVPGDPDQPKGPESFTRAITDLEGLLQQALDIAGQANDQVPAGGPSSKSSLKPPSPAQTFRKTPQMATARETSYESSSSSDAESSTGSSGLDEEQNRTTIPMKYGRQGDHVTVVEPDDADRYHSQFKSHRNATPHPSALMRSSANPSSSAGTRFEPHNGGEKSRTLTAPGPYMAKADIQSGPTLSPLQITIRGDPVDVENVLLNKAGVASSSVDTADWAVKRQPTTASRRHSAGTKPGDTTQISWPPQPLGEDLQGSVLRERRPSKTVAPVEITANASVYSDPKSFSSGDDKEPIAYFTDRPASNLHRRSAPQRKQADEAPPPTARATPWEDTLSPLPSDLGGRGPGSDPKSLDLNHRHHFSIREPKMFRLDRSHKRSPIARDWSISKKRWVALVTCINTALMGLIIGIYAGEVPAIQYNIVDEHHYTILGNVVLFLGLAVSTSIFWPLPLLYGRKPFTLAALALLVPLQFPQAVAVSGFRTPYTPTYRVALLLSRALAGLVMGFANINFIATLLDLFGASLQSVNPHEEVVNENDVRRHGGGMGIWLGVWTWCFIGSIGLGFFIGAVIISGLAVDWGFWITIILTAFVLVLNVLVPEVRRSPYRRSVADVRTPTELTRRVARGEIKMHLYSTGPKWWIEEVMAGSTLCVRMLKQPGFLVLSTYVGWIYGQIVMVIVLLGALTSTYYRYRPQYVGLCVLAIPLGALLAVPFQRASVLSRSRQKPPRTDSMTVKKRLTWTSHFVRRAVFMVLLPFAGLAYTLASVGPQVSVAAPTVFAGLIGFLSNLAIAECNGILMETYDTSDLQAGMTGRPRRNLPEDVRKKRTNFSSFPRVTAAFAISQTMAFIIAAAATAAGGGITRRLGAQAATAIVAGILLILTLMLIAVVTRFKEIQIIPSQRYGTNVLSGPEDEWKPVIIGNPSGTTRRMSILELGNMTRWKEIRRRNRLTGLEGY